MRRYPEADRRKDGLTLKRKFSPGSEWLYFKVYCGCKTAEKALTGIVLPYVEQGIRQGTFEYFHFVRYRDEFFSPAHPFF